MIASHKRALLTAALVVLAVGGNQTFAQTRPFYDQIKIGVLTDISGLCAVLAGPGSVEAGVRYTNAVAFVDQIDRQSRRGGGYVTIQSEQIQGWIVVTGAGGGIGAGIAQRLCERGACVIVADLDLAAAKETAARLCREGHRAQAGHVDVTEETSVEALGDVAIRHGNLVGWVNNAGISEVIPLTDMSVEAWDRMMSVNVRGVFLGTRAAARRMESGGAIVNLASVSSVIAFPHRSHYGASKGAVAAFTKHAAIDLAPRGIRVNAVGPGTIESQMTRGRLSDPEQLRWTLQRVPAGRVGQPEDIGNAVAFLCSQDAAYITGVVLMCDGGWTAAA